MSSSRALVHSQTASRSAVKAKVAIATPGAERKSIILSISYASAAEDRFFAPSLALPSAEVMAAGSEADEMARLEARLHQLELDNAQRRLEIDHVGTALGGLEQHAEAAGTLVLHVLVCSLLMNVGKMFPSFCYRSEVNYSTRLALAIGMMPRGEVCAGIIVSAIALDVRVHRTWGSSDEPAPPLSLAKTLPSLSYAVADAAHSRARMFESPTLVRRRTA